jgi:hypothetical protein
MDDQLNFESTPLNRRTVLKAVGVAVVAGHAISAGSESSASLLTVPSGAVDRNSAPLGARLQGVQHFGLTVQNMDRAFEFYTEVLGGTEIMRDGDFQGD